MRSTNQWSILAGGLLIFACTLPAHAYDAETHALIAYKAYQGSVFAQNGPGSVIQRLGLDRLDVPTPFNAYWQATGSAPGPVSYYDDTSASNFDPAMYPRQPNGYEQCQMQHLAPLPPITGTNWLKGDPMLGTDGLTVTFLPIENWLMRGDLREDDLSPLLYSTIASDRCGQPDGDPYGQIVRVFNHFYDPIHDVGLVGTKSVDWALGYVDSFATPPVVDTNRRNHFTYEDARENMWRALTGERGRSSPPYTAAARAADAQERLYRWATTFRSLGDVIHLLQDGASPQHVRDDPHSPVGTSKEQQAFEGFTNARVLNQTVGDTNAYVRGFFLRSAYQKAVPPIVLGSSPYPIPVFATPLRFYTTRLKGDGPSVLPDNRYGMMDYANRSFFTGGTLPGMSGNTFQRPATPVDGAHGYTQSQVPCVLSSALGNSWRHDLKCTHWMHAIPDSVTSGYGDTLPTVEGSIQFTQPPLAAFSAFTIANCPPAQCRYTVGLEELDNMANFAVPRAIGYSAGLINYFFRGQLTVTAPADGLYALVNHGTPHTVSQGYPYLVSNPAKIFGFEQVRLNVQNTTSTPTESGTGSPISKATGGTGAQLVAVARYHRNVCYTTTLTGEVSQDENNVVHPPAGCTVATMRSAYQEISVSTPIAVTPSMLDGTPVALTFDFSGDPIPINATDLFIQAVYRGPLGDEPDGIAVGLVDVSEPTYMLVFNGTDYVLKNNQWQLPTGSDPAAEALATIQICNSTSKVYGSSAPGLPVVHILRLAALRDFTAQIYSIGIVGSNGLVFRNIYGQWQGDQRQAVDERGTGFNPDLMFYGRGEILGDYGEYAFQNVGMLPNPIPSMWGLPTPPTAGSENIGALITPGTTTCPF